MTKRDPFFCLFSNYLIVMFVFFTERPKRKGPKLIVIKVYMFHRSETIRFYKTYFVLQKKKKKKKEYTAFHPPLTITSLE